MCEQLEPATTLSTMSVNNLLKVITRQFVTLHSFQYVDMDIVMNMGNMGPVSSV